MHPGLNLNNLKYFYDAVETKSISEAARRNFVTQSAVSQGIQKLEKALSLILITHQRNYFKLTPEGENIYSLTQQIFRTVKSMYDVSHELQGVVSGQINIACTQSIAMNLIAPLLQKAKLQFPQMSVNLKIGKMENISLMLKRGVMDVGIVVESELCEQFEKQVIQNGFFHLYAKKGIKQKIDEGIYVDHATGLYVNKLQESYRKHQEKELKILQELDSWQVLAKCAENGIGHCFLPDFIVSSDTLKPCQNFMPIPYTIVAIYPKGVQLTRASKAFLQLLQTKL